MNKRRRNIIIVIIILFFLLRKKKKPLVPEQKPSSSIVGTNTATMETGKPYANGIPPDFVPTKPIEFVP